MGCFCLGALTRRAAANVSYWLIFVNTLSQLFDINLVSADSLNHSHFCTL